MQAEVRFVTRTCPYSPQAQLQGSLQDAPGYFMKRLIDAGLRFVSFTLRKPHTTVALLSAEEEVSPPEDSTSKRLGQVSLQSLCRLF